MKNVRAYGSAILLGVVLSAGWSLAEHRGAERRDAEWKAGISAWATECVAEHRCTPEQSQEQE